jgi:hypothetical protein
MIVEVDFRKHPLYSRNSFYKPYCKIWNANVLTIHIEKTNVRVRLLNDDGTIFKTIDTSFKYIVNKSAVVEFQ